MKDLVSFEIDLTTDPDLIDESWLVTFGTMTKMLLKYMFGGAAAPVKIRGTSSQISAFTDALGREKRYMDSFIKHGLSDERTLRSRSTLMKAVSRFERETGLRWPYSN